MRVLSSLLLLALPLSVHAERDSDACLSALDPKAGAERICEDFTSYREGGKEIVEAQKSCVQFYTGVIEAAKLTCRYVKEANEFDLNRPAAVNESRDPTFSGTMELFDVNAAKFSQSWYMNFFNMQDHVRRLHDRYAQYLGSMAEASLKLASKEINSCGEPAMKASVTYLGLSYYEAREGKRIFEKVDKLLRDMTTQAYNNLQALKEHRAKNNKVTDGLSSTGAREAATAVFSDFTGGVKASEVGASGAAGSPVVDAGKKAAVDAAAQQVTESAFTKVGGQMAVTGTEDALIRAAGRGLIQHAPLGVGVVFTVKDITTDLLNHKRPDALALIATGAHLIVLVAGHAGSFGSGGLSYVVAAGLDGMIALIENRVRSWLRGLNQMQLNSYLPFASQYVNKINPTASSKDASMAWHRWNRKNYFNPSTPKQTLFQEITLEDVVPKCALDEMAVSGY